MSTLLSKQYVQLNELREIPLPEETESYKPVPHYDLAVNLGKVANDLLPGFSLRKSQFGLARNGNQLFGIHSYQNGSEEMGLSIGFRNSYDKSMSVGICIGASVFVCDNLCFSGDIIVMRKHTTYVWADLEEQIVNTIYRSRNNFTHIQEDSDKMKRLNVDNDSAYKIMGLLYGKGMITPRQLPTMKDEWINPTYEDFQPRNLWSLYNSATESLKSCQPNKIMERHIKVHEFFNQLNQGA